MIRVTNLADYGVLLTTWLARQGGGTSPLDAPFLAASEIARGTGLPAPTTGKLLRQLARAGVLASTRGARGGYRLARPAPEITMLEVLEALDGPIALTACLDEDHGDACGVTALCPTRTNWARINGAIREALAGISLAEMFEPASPALVELAPLAPIPTEESR